VRTRAKRESVAARTDASGAPGSGAAMTRPRRPRILIAERNPRLAAMLEKGLAAHGFVTTTVHDGPSVLGMARGNAFDLLVLDVELPGPDGIGLVGKLRNRGARLPVTLLLVGEEPSEHGADDVLSKPFAFAELLGRVREQLGAPTPC
jgi:DNA-binding response OmpR family regulator